MPVPQENLYFVEQASCLFRWAYGRVLRPTAQEILTKSGTGILPVSYIGARCEFKLISYNNINRGLSRGVGAAFLVFLYP
ncbi:hypothetical protein QUB19_27935 [Microcoleus sp. B4-C5]|uniref:hypothetical protein n=1 Tax=unclassified Microcoleus TaxID=2642155 RepID=UPI002FD3959A